MRDEARERARSMVPQTELSDEPHEVCREDYVGYFSN
jgi:hypothetical protein